MAKLKLSRRLFLAAGPATALAGTVRAQSRPTRTLTVFKSPTCACCDGWVTHMRAAGFSTTVRVIADLRAVRLAHGLPDALASCHTGVIGGYVVEGHVPAADVMRLLAERPEAVGITVPGMPLGSPGMEAGGRREPFETLLVLRSGQTRVFARHNRAV